MAGKEEKVEGDDDDDLDTLLDSALEDFEKKPPLPKSCGSDGLTNKSKETASPKESAAENLDFFGLSESDIEAAAEEFEKSMKAMLGEDDELLKQWNEFTEKATTCKPEETEDGPPENTEGFEAHLLKTMKDMAESAKGMNNPPEMDENFFKAMADMKMDTGNEMPDHGIFPMMQGMMMNLLSKDVLYPALDDLRLKYPPWLKENKDVIKSDVYENYTQQYKLICDICSEYDNESDQDSEETKKERFERLMILMHKMQRYGQPPQELIGDNSTPFSMGGFPPSTSDNIPPNKCPMM